MGIATDDRIVTHLVWADDTLAVMIQELQDAMRDKFGLLLQPAKCTFARFGPQSHEPISDILPEILRQMTRDKVLRVCASWGILYRLIWGTRPNEAQKGQRRGRHTT